MANWVITLNNCCQLLVIKCLLKLITSILNHSTAQLILIQIGILEAAQHHVASSEFSNVSTDSFTNHPLKDMMDLEQTTNSGYMGIRIAPMVLSSGKGMDIREKCENNYVMND